MSTVEAVKHVLLDAGAAWVLWLLAGLSVASLGVFVERFVSYRRGEGNMREIARGVHEQLDAGDVAGAIALLDRFEDVAARVAAAGLRLCARGPTAVEKAMSSRIALEREVLEQRLTFLATLGSNAPFIGLLGTVIGIIGAFEELGHGAAGHGGAGAAGQVASAAVMSAIAEALVVTAVGIAVALPAVAAYNYLQSRVASILAASDVLSNLVLAYVSGDDLPPGGGA